MKITESQIRKIVRSQILKEMPSYGSPTTSPSTVASDLLSLIEKADEQGLAVEIGSGIMDYRAAGPNSLEIDFEGPGGDLVTYVVTFTQK